MEADTRCGGNLNTSSVIACGLVHGESSSSNVSFTARKQLEVFLPTWKHRRHRSSSTSQNFNGLSQLSTCAVRYESSNFRAAQQVHS